MDAPVTVGDTEDATDTSEAPPHWYCIVCGYLVADPQDAITLPGHPAVEAHLNPYGVVFQVRTFAVAQVSVSGPLVPAYTWYPGYAWRLATCIGCNEHLGWAYLRVDGEGRGAFAGLIDSRITLR